MGPRFLNEGDTQTVMAWLYRTSTRLALDAIRRRKVRGGRRLGDPGGRAMPEDEVNVVAAGLSSSLPCGSFEDSVGARRLVISLARDIPPEELEAAIVCRVDGVSQPEAAEILGVSERTIRRLLTRFDEHAARWRKEFSS
jgi:RNA polymerase sigma-70 factor, ECF subfamily